MQAKKSKKILENVKQTYNIIAQEFSKSRQYVGKEFDLFEPYLKPNQTIIDLGCGNGRLLKFLLKTPKKINYIGIDNSEKILDEAKKNYPEQKFILGDQLKIPLEDGKVDIIFNIRAFHHLPTKKHQLEGLKEMKRVLKKDGILILTVWNLWQKKYWKDLAKAIFRSIYTFGQYQYNDTFISWNNKESRYYHAFTKPELNNLFIKSGLKILSSPTNDKNKNHEPEQIAKHSHDYIMIAQKQ